MTSHWSSLLNASCGEAISILCNAKLVNRAVSRYNMETAPKDAVYKAKNTVSLG